MSAASLRRLLLVSCGLLGVSGSGCQSTAGSGLSVPGLPESAPRVEILEDAERGDRVGFVISRLKESDRAWLEGEGFEERARRVFAVHARAANAPEALDAAVVPALSGEYSLEARGLVFRASFPLREGMRYSGDLTLPSIRPPPGSDARRTGHYSWYIQIDAEPAAPRARVESVYPSSDVLPENQLKFYIRFSHPMSVGEAYERVRLVRDDGLEIAYPFLELDEELWDPEGKRFTLFIDPGRIKRELLPREEEGPALLAGHRYRLIIAREWIDARGEPMIEGHEKSFRVTPPDYQMPRMANWEIDPPAAGTRDALAVRFPEPLDRALLERIVWVENAAGEALDGTLAIDDAERRWSFNPEVPWTAGAHRLVAESILEDLAGNSLARPFEVDLFTRVKEEIVRVSLGRDFEVR